MAAVGDLDDETWNRIIDVNLTGPMRMIRAAIPQFLAQGEGVFVTIASLGGLFGARAGAAYTASKHGVIGLARNVAYMYARRGIRSNIVAPGGVRTSIREGIAFNPEGAGVAMSGLNLNPRTGEPEEIARVALFLASDDASFVNGATVVADAGWSCVPDLPSIFPCRAGDGGLFRPRGRLRRNASRPGPIGPPGKRIGSDAR